MRPFMDSVLLLDLKLGSHKEKKGKLNHLTQSCFLITHM